MLAESRERLLDLLSDADVVLDVGGWAKPLARADWVIDLMPYETRGVYGEPDPEPERFDESRWVQRDICHRRPWPFENDQFDFAVCSHTLEDVRDPVWVCSEIARVARAGYLEVPSRLEEQAYGVHGPWVGWSHHRWLVDVRPGRIEFVFKPGVLQGRPEIQVTAEAAARLSPRERVQTLFWRQGFEYAERIFVEPGELDRYLAEPLRDLSGSARQAGAPSLPERLRRRLSR